MGWQWRLFYNWWNQRREKLAVNHCARKKTETEKKLQSRRQQQDLRRENLLQITNSTQYRQSRMLARWSIDKLHPKWISAALLLGVSNWMPTWSRAAEKRQNIARSDFFMLLRFYDIGKKKATEQEALIGFLWFHIFMHSTPSHGWLRPRRALTCCGTHSLSVAFCNCTYWAFIDCSMPHEFFFCCCRAAPQSIESFENLCNYSAIKRGKIFFCGPMSNSFFFWFNRVSCFSSMAEVEKFYQRTSKKFNRFQIPFIEFT